MALFYRPLVIECVDPSFFRHAGHASAVAHYGFLFLMVINLVSGFHALGTLMAIGVMILPSAAARFWVQTIDQVLVAALLISIGGCYFGLLLSFHLDLPSGPAIIISLGTVYILSIVLGTHGGLLNRLVPKRHLKS